MADDRTYIRVHDGMDDHPKIVGLSDGGFRLLMRAWSYCSRQLTDGRLPDAAWRSRGSAKARRELISAGLAHVPGDGCTHNHCPEPPPGHVQMHDYLEHQRSAAEVADLRRRRAEAGSKGGKSRANAQASAKQVLQQTPSKTVASTETETEQENSSKGGSHVSSAVPADPPLYSDRCQWHANTEAPPKCGACADVRKANAAKPRAALALVADESLPWCGRCSEFTRQLETPVGVMRCPECHPLAEEAS